MRSFRDIPIRQKLIVTMVVTTAVALLLSGAGIIVLDSVYYRTHLRADLSAQAQIIAENSTAAVAFADASAAREMLGALRARPHVIMACIVMLDGTPLARYARPGADRSCPAAPPGDEIRFTRDTLIVTRPIVLKDRVLGTLVLLYDLEEIWERLRVYGATVLILLLGSGLIALAVSSQLRALIVTPIAELAGAAARVSATRDYSVRARKISADELGVLVDSFNGMLAGIQSRDDDLRRALAERQAALDEARNTRDSLRTTLASIGDAVVATDTRGDVVFANPVAQNLLRASESDMIRHPLARYFRLVDEHSRESIETPVARALREGRVVSNHAILLVREGVEVPVDDSASPIRNDRGEITGAVLIFRDITQRRQDEAALRSAREQLQLVTDTMASSVARCRRDLRYVWVSRQYGRWIDLPPEQMAGQPIRDALGDEAYRAILPYMERVLAGERVEFEGAIRYRTIGARWIRATYVPTHDRSGAVDGWVSEVTDITDLKQAQANIVKINEELRRSNLSLGRSNEDLERFAYIASHDLQEPLRMITTYTQLLFRAYAGEWKGDAAGFVANIVDGARRIRTLLSDLLAYTEINAETEEPLGAVDLHAAFESARANLKAAIEESGASVACDPLPRVGGREGHFVSLLQNLIGNAIKYRSQDPPRIHVTARTVGEQLQIAVSDNGIGIDPEYHQKIFLAFKRLHGRKIPGSGIGLAICQRVVERYGGRIWVESRAGAGSTFVFSLPETALSTQERSDGHAAV